MRSMRAVIVVALVLAPCALAAQPAGAEQPPSAGSAGFQPRFSVHAAAGLTIQAGNVQSASIGYSPVPRLSFLVNLERNHVPTRVERYTGGFAATRGGTMQVVSGEVRFDLLSGRRSSPYILAGAGRGVSRPNVNDVFTDRVRNDLTVVFAGTGVRVPVGRNVSVFGDVRFALAAERDVVMPSLPVRGGVTLHF
jgi:hypothetical protein